MRPTKNIMLFVVLVFACHASFSQCVDSTNIYFFTYNGHSYDVVKENKTWTAASTCAVNRNGYLAEINDKEEHNAIFDELRNNAGIVTNNTQNQFGTASIWLGGSDAGTEGDWIWDGNNDGLGPQFWRGGSNGAPVDGSYTNWGISPAEPDNSGGQDHLTLIIKPSAVNFGLWNDLISTNSIYYLIEYDNFLSTENLGLESKLSVFPSPFQDYITVENNSSVEIDRIEIFNLMGLKIKTINPDQISNNVINVSDLNKGMYILSIQFVNGRLISQKIIK